MKNLKEDFVFEVRENGGLLDCVRKELNSLPAGKVKSYVVLKERGRERVFASHIASATLEKRWKSEIGREYLNEVAVLTISEAEQE